MCNIGALVSVWKAFTADLMVSREIGKTQATSNALNETPHASVRDLAAFNYWNYI